MPKAVLLEAVRTPIGRFKGGLSKFSARDLGVKVVSELIRRVPQAAESDGVILGQVVQAGQGQNPARQVAAESGVKLTTPAITLNSVCIASMDAVADAARRVERKEGDMFIVGGIESMTNAPHVSSVRKGTHSGSIEFTDALINEGLWCALSDESMGVLSDRANHELGVSREEQDVYAVQSQNRAEKSQKEGLLAEEIVEINDGNSRIEHDECVRPGTNPQKLQNLRPAFTPDGTITAGNASQLSDGASGGLVTSLEYCDRVGRTPLAHIVDWANVAGPDTTLHLKPARAIRKLLERNELQLSDIDLFEINEAFAGVVVATQRDLDLPNDVINVNGGAIALGHPLGASGFRLVLTLAKELKRRGGGRGIATLCGGGGQGMALLIEVEDS
ncbi:MAG TPA: acetyl-CoA C-acyltransferase [Bacillales bacterium]